MRAKSSDGGNMPFVGGRYYANALAGHAIEAAREAEAALLALKQKSALNGKANASADEYGAASDGGADGESSEPASEGKAPIHRIEIEAAELVPAHSGRANRGFVARVHRDSGSSDSASSPSGASGGSRPPLPGQLPSRGYAAKPETHVFAGHGDLLDYLKNELQTGADR
jgi:hypothetical protein